MGAKERCELEGAGIDGGQTEVSDGWVVEATAVSTDIGKGKARPARVGGGLLTEWKKQDGSVNSDRQCCGEVLKGHIWLGYRKKNRLKKVGMPAGGRS